MQKVKIQQLCTSATHKQNDSIFLRLCDSVQCRRGYYFEHVSYISALEHIMMLILSSYVLLACINIIYKYGHSWVI